MVSRGNCWLSVEGIRDQLPLTGGDCFLLAPGSKYALRDNPRTRAGSLCEAAPKNGSNVIHYGGGGVPTTIISGWFRFDESSVKSLKRLLPELILVKADQAQTLALHATLQLLASEMAEPAPGAEVMVNRLADILFIQCVRAHIASSSGTCKSGCFTAPSLIFSFSRFNSQASQEGVGAFCSINCLAFSSAQNSAGILVCIDV